jgi:hypothetical protein
MPLAITVVISVTRCNDNASETPWRRRYYLGQGLAIKGTPGAQIAPAHIHQTPTLIMQFKVFAFVAALFTVAAAQTDCVSVAVLQECSTC